MIQKSDYFNIENIDMFKISFQNINVSNKYQTYHFIFSYRKNFICYKC